ncbi:zinc finger BED domain-containing protein DAYSLEEPER-like [Silene latifolia]|uniref:zinc finger BED domain-containing protein DAYSLEEPER-like n=1 Tax=Silene latifolia TaxID=37657 RepID=UPI003D7865F4
MDPRYKLKLVKFTLSKLYGEDDGDIWARTIDESIHDLYLEYVAQTLPLPWIHTEQRYDEFIKAESLEDEVGPPSDVGISDFEVYISDFSSNSETFELNQYLEEDLLPRDELDVIDWWKFKRIQYPTLSKMAADLLSITFSTVHRDSVFDTQTRNLDSHQCSLRPGTLEAMVCAKDWLQFGTEQGSDTVGIMITPLTVKKEE